MSDSPNPAPVAVLDDDVQFIRMVERILRTEQIPIQPVTTPDLDEAARVVAMTGCRAALVDIYMYGEVAGFQLIERLRAQPETSDLRLIVTSGAYREIARHVPFLQQHHCSILPKPFEVDALILRVTGQDEDSAAVAFPSQAAPHRCEAPASMQRNQGTWRFFTNPLRRVEPTA